MLDSSRCALIDLLFLILWNFVQKVSISELMRRSRIFHSRGMFFWEEEKRRENIRDWLPETETQPVREGSLHDVFF